MALNFHSVFYYGHKIDETNNMINFKEGAGPELTAAIPVGRYTMTKFFETVVATLNAASSLDWTFVIDRATRIVTITSSGTASLLLGSGVNAASSPSSLMGFDAVDRIDNTLFVGDFASGESYSPQFPLQDYKGSDKNKRLINATVSKSASGDKVSVQSFGVDRLIKFNIKWVMNHPSGGVHRNNPNAVEELTSFMDYITEKNPIEFMENESDLDSFQKVYLESTPQSQDGISYDLTEYVDRDVPDVYETGLLTFKVINIE